MTTAEEVLQAVEKEALRPRELVERLRATSEEPRVREVVWQLLDSGRLALTQDRKLRAAPGHR